MYTNTHTNILIVQRLWWSQNILVFVFLFPFLLKLHILFYLVSMACWKSFVLISASPVKTKVSFRQKSVLTAVKAGLGDQDIWVSSAALFSASRLPPDSAAKTLGTEMSRSQRNYRDMFCWWRDAHAFFGLPSGHIHFLAINAVTEFVSF